MATLLTALLRVLLRNCAKRTKQEFLDTDSLQFQTFAWTTYGKFSNLLISLAGENVTYM